MFVREPNRHTVFRVYSLCHTYSLTKDFPSLVLDRLAKSFGRDRTAARATVGGEFPTLALSIGEVGASFPHGPRFRRPPCDPGRWDCPSPVLTLAPRRSPPHTARSLRADSHTPLRGMVCFHGRSMVHRPSMSGYSWSGQVPRAPLHVRGVPSHVMVSSTMSVGLLPTFIAPTGSCASPPPSSCLGGTLNTRSMQVAVSPCWEEDLPDVLSAHLSLRAWTPTPAARGGHRPVTSSTTSAFPSFGPGRRFAKPVQRFQYGALLEAAVIS